MSEDHRQLGHALMALPPEDYAVLLGGDMMLALRFKLAIAGTLVRLGNERREG